MENKTQLEFKPKTTKRINLRIDSDLAEELHKLHTHSKLTQSALIRIGLRNLMEEVRLYGKVELSV